MIGSRTAKAISFGGTLRTDGLARLSVACWVLVAGCQFEIPSDGPSPDLALVAMNDFGALQKPGVLQLSVLDAPTDAVSLTTEGMTDWAHWGGTNHNQSISADRKNQDSHLIGDTGVIPSTDTPVAYHDNAFGYYWNDGSPTGSVNVEHAATTGIYQSGVNHGFSLTCAADTVQRTLKLYLGGYHSRGKLTLSLSDNSAGVGDDSRSNLTGDFNAVYSITFSSPTPGAQLAIAWIDEQDDGQGNVTLQAATVP